MRGATLTSVLGPLSTSATSNPYSRFPAAATSNKLQPPSPPSGRSRKHLGESKERTHSPSSTSSSYANRRHNRSATSPTSMTPRNPSTLPSLTRSATAFDPPSNELKSLKKKFEKLKSLSARDKLLVEQLRCEVLPLFSFLLGCTLSKIQIFIANRKIAQSVIRVLKSE